MTAVYPRERVEAITRPLSLAAAYRIILKSHLSSPLAVYPSKSRFCDGRTYAVLYGANDFATAFVEVVVRDRLVQTDGVLCHSATLLRAVGWNSPWPATSH